MADQAQYHYQQHQYHQEQQQRLQNDLRDDQPGLEAAPSRYSTAPIPYAPATPSADILSTGAQTAVTEAKWAENQVYTAPPEPEPPKRRRVLGLTVPVFWGIIIVLVVILAAGVAGGVAGGLSAQKSNVSSSPASPSDTATADIQSTSTATSSSGPSSTATGAKPSSAPTTRPTGASAGTTLPAPTDGGCPRINETTYTPTDASGAVMGLNSGPGQTLCQLCEINYPSGAAYGNPGIYDILKTYVSTFEECMTLCAAHNQAYAKNLASGAVGAGGYCRSVAMIKQPGEYCYLKNGTGKSDTRGRPKDYVSAIVIVGLTDE